MWLLEVAQDGGCSKLENLLSEGRDSLASAPANVAIRQSRSLEPDSLALGKVASLPRQLTD